MNFFVAQDTELDAIAATYGLYRKIGFASAETDVELRERIRAVISQVLTAGLISFPPDLDTPFASHPKSCSHDFVEMGFMHSKMVCKHCDQEQKA